MTNDDPQRNDINTEQIKSTSGIDKIRDIIFGDEISFWQNKYNHLKKECDRLKNKLAELEKKFEESEKVASKNVDDIKSSSESQQHELQQLIENMKDEFEQKIKQLAETKVDKSQIGQAFIEWGMKVKKEVS